MFAAEVRLDGPQGDAGFLIRGDPNVNIRIGGADGGVTGRLGFRSGEIPCVRAVAAETTNAPSDRGLTFWWVKGQSNMGQ